MPCSHCCHDGTQAVPYTSFLSVFILVQKFDSFVFRSKPNRKVKGKPPVRSKPLCYSREQPRRVIDRQGELARLLKEKKKGMKRMDELMIGE